MKMNLFQKFCKGVVRINSQRISARYSPRSTFSNFTTQHFIQICQCVSKKNIEKSSQTRNR